MIFSKNTKLSSKIIAVLSILSLGLISSTYLFTPKTSAAPNSTIYIDPASYSANIGDSFNVDVTINPGTNQVSAVELHITFDHTVLNLDSVTASSAFSTVLQAAAIDNSAGTASVILGVPLSGPNVTTTSDVATLTFHGIAAGTNSLVTIANTTQAAADGETGDVITSRTGAQITVAAQTYGNADFALLAADWLQTKTSDADVNNDGTVNSRDLGIMMSNWGS